MIRLTWLKLALLACAGGAAYGVAIHAVDFVETRKIAKVTETLEANGLDWAEAIPDGMVVVLSGEAPDEAARFRAITLVSHIANPAHIRDTMTVPPPEDLPLLAYQVDIMRNDDSVVMHGLVPAGPDATVDFLARLNALSPGLEVSNVLTEAMSPAPETWQAAAELGLAVLAALPQVRVEITPERVVIDGVIPAEADVAAWTQELQAQAPEGVALSVNLRQARQRLSPFTLQLHHDGTDVQVDSCVVETEADAQRIAEALAATGSSSESNCRIALGAPDSAWPEVAASAIDTLATLGDGAITITDTQITVVPGDATSPDDLSTQGAALSAALSAPYHVSVLASQSGSDSEEGATLLLTRSPEGPVTLDGAIASAQEETVLASLAAARFGAHNVSQMIRLAEDLPANWALRSMAAIDALALLSEGSVTVTADAITVSGITPDPAGSAAITAAMRAKLDADQALAINVTYEPPPEEDSGLDPAACVARINTLLEGHKIVFDPGSKELRDADLPVVDSIAEVLRDCPDAPIEIGGHTDSQGGEEQNQRLSQARAQAVLDALIARRALTGQLTAKGYGETQPIADNASEDGREANRRIAFRLTVPETGDVDTGDNDTGDIEETTDGSD